MFGLDTRDRTIIGVASGLVIINILVMFVLAVTTFAEIALLAFSTPILGFVIYGAALTGGQYIADIGIETENTPLATAGVVLLQAGFGTIGAALLSVLPREWHLIALGATAVLTTLFTVVVTAYVLWTDRSLEHWRMYANYCFGAAFLVVLVGSFVLTPLLLLGFLLTFAGFTFMLGFDIWHAMTDQTGKNPWWHGVRVYVAVMGVFVHILRIIVRILIALASE